MGVVIHVPNTHNTRTSSSGGYCLHRIRAVYQPWIGQFTSYVFSHPHMAADSTPKYITAVEQYWSIIGEYY